MKVRRDLPNPIQNNQPLRLTKVEWIAGSRRRASRGRACQRRRAHRRARPLAPSVPLRGPLPWPSGLGLFKPVGRKIRGRNMPQVHARGIFLPPFFCPAVRGNSPAARPSDSRYLRGPAAPREPGFEQEDREGLEGNAVKFRCRPIHFSRGAAVPRSQDRAGALFYLKKLK